MKRKPPKHRTYLVTIWEERGHDMKNNEWRYMLADSHTEYRGGFVSLEAVVAELKRHVAQLQQELSQ